MLALLTSLLISFGATHIHVTHCHHGAWCRGTANAYMPNGHGPSVCKFKAWPPYFQPVVVYGCRATTKARMVREQFGDARRAGSEGDFDARTRREQPSSHTMTNDMAGLAGHR